MTSRICKLLMLTGLILLSAGITTKGFAQTGVTQQSRTEKTVKGTVKDEQGEPLIGVSVVVKGTANGTVTDVDGKFSIMCNGDDVLVISYIGFQTIEKKAGNTSFQALIMREDSKVLDEVIVIGYGTTTRKHVIGAVDQVKEKLIKDRPVANLTQALQGASPSLTIQQRSMNPNDNSMNINIRGVSSMNNNDPLIVIDGMIANDVKAMNMLCLLYTSDAADE